VAALLLAPAAASAGGFTYPGQGADALSRGGAFTARADDPSGIFYNPGALARLKGTHIVLSGNVIWEDIRFQRLVYDASTGKSSEFYPQKPTVKMPEVQNQTGPFLSPIIGASTDLGLDLLDRIGLKLLIGFYGPHTHNTRDFPRWCKKDVTPCEPTTSDDADGVTSPARYDTGYIEMLVTYPSVGLAWEPLPGLRIGGVFQMVYVNVSIETVVTGINAAPKTREDELSDLDIRVDSSDSFSATGVIGVHWAPMSFLEWGASVRIGYPIETDGTVAVDSKMGIHNLVDPNPASISIAWRMPWVIRSGARFISRDDKGRERFDVELDFVYETTSEMDKFLIETDAKFGGTAFKELNQDHMWKDTWSLRFGGSYQLWDLIPDGMLRVNLGGFYESEAMPEEYTRLDFLPLARWGVGGGLGVKWRWLNLTVGYMHIFHDKRTVEGSKIQQMAPLNPPVGSMIGDGNLAVDIDMLIIGLGASFGGGEKPGQPTCTFCP